MADHWVLLQIQVPPALRVTSNGAMDTAPSIISANAQDQPNNHKSGKGA